VFKSVVSSDRKWDRVEIALQFLCAGDLNQVIRINVFDFMAMRRDRRVGFTDTTVRVLCSQGSFDLRSDRGELVGRLLLDHRAPITCPRFPDYRLKGIQVAPMLAVDFSSSYVSFFTTNRVQHISNGILTYGNLINGVFDNLRNICLGQHWLAYGFADFPERKLMPLSMSRTHRKMKSVKALISAYWSFRDHASYPENAPLKPVFVEARSVARERWEQHRAITLVVVLTNGRFCDLPDAVNELVDAQEDPIIVILVTIGGTPREAEMIFHPPDGKLRHTDGRAAERTMLNIVSYEKNCHCADQGLEARMVPSIHKMGLEWIDRVGFNPFA
jgi:hypothetical protein